MTGLLCVVHDIAVARLGQCGLQQILLAGGIDAFNNIPTCCFHLAALLKLL